MIPAGTTLQFVVSGHVSSWSPIEADASSIEGRVTNALMPFLGVKEVRVVPASWALGGLLEYEYTASVAVTTKATHARAEDVTGWIQDAFYRATNQPARIVSASDPLAPAVEDNGLGAWLSRLGAGVQSTVSIVAVAAVLIVAAVLYKK